MKGNTKQKSFKQQLKATAMRLTRGRIRHVGRTLHPQGTFKRWWDLSLAVCVLYNSIFCPLHIAFDLDISVVHRILYRVVDLVFIADVGVNFNTGYFEQNALIMDQTKIAMRYMKTWFVVDAISSIPMELMFSSSMYGDQASFMRLNKLLRLFKLAKMLSVMRLSRLHRVFNRWEMLPQLKFAVLDIASYVTLCLLWAHWFACSFFFVAKVDGLQEHAWFKQAKETHAWEGMLVKEPYTEYILSLYHAVMVMFTIDMNFRPENNRERVVTISFGCVGAVIVLYSLSTVTYIVQETLSLQTKSYRKKVDHVNDFIRRKNLPETLASGMIQYYEYLRHRDHFSLEIGDAMLLNELPTGLKEDVMMRINSRVVQGELLKRASPTLAAGIVPKLGLRHVSPNEILLEKGSPALELYLLVHGEVAAWEADVLQKGIHEPVVLSVGDFVGEAALAGLERRGLPPESPVSAAAITFCEVHVLSRKDAISLLDSLKADERGEWTKLAAYHAEGLPFSEAEFKSKRSSELDVEVAEAEDYQDILTPRSSTKVDDAQAETIEKLHEELNLEREWRIRETELRQSIERTCSRLQEKVNKLEIELTRAQS